jgi:hypothetical protein
VRREVARIDPAHLPEIKIRNDDWGKDAHRPRGARPRLVAWETGTGPLPGSSKHAPGWYILVVASEGQTFSKSRVFLVTPGANKDL